MSTARQGENKARNYVYRLLKYRNRSEKEIRDKLLKRKFPPEVMDKVIQGLKDNGYIDDLKFAQEWLNFRLKVPFGLKRIIFELKQKGIEEEIIKQVINCSQVNRTQSEALADIAGRRLALMRRREKDKVKLRRKIYGFLLRRGFSPADIMDCLQRLIPF